MSPSLRLNILELTLLDFIIICNFLKLFIELSDLIADHNLLCIVLNDDIDLLIEVIFLLYQSIEFVPDILLKVLDIGDVT